MKIGNIGYLHISKMSRLKRWCFTLNNYTSEEEDHIKAVINEDTVDFAVIGRETGDSGTPHLQGYVNMSETKRLIGMKKIIGNRAYIAGAKGSDVENDTYCTKAGDVMLRIGEPLNRANKVPFRMAKMANMYRENEDVNFREMGEAWHTCWLMHKRKIKEDAEDQDMLDTRKRQKRMYENVLWNTWQKELLETFETTPDPRKVIWIWDFKGGVGKSYMTGYLAVMKKALETNTTTMKDVAYMYNGQKIVIFDLARHNMEYVNYGTIEAIKNGSITSPKYESKAKRFEIPHVIIFANAPPNMSKMSADRWDIRRINEENEFITYREEDFETEMDKQWEDIKRDLFDE